ncbi:EPIDERMAL PATTERNING FACTOR-like protein 1 isoform X1 [Carica papaya]|uniref:EPIDERMAL PATTERNING FACTOR-like protein 1 isoform X1 n=1 Tax=Carica papaya TaxID=3649 RepID=UPI000B8C7510|nr:EPIDERMAL PATTERNING FACTOR-like protein 1 isoform X1 [Carica papaya]
MVKRKMWFFITVVSTHVIISWVAVTGNHLTSYDSSSSPQPRQTLSFSEPGFRSKQVYGRELSRLGSRPPDCEHKCGGCRPCNAIQIPANSHHFGVEYANYEPEGWKCKCGTSFFNP